MESSARGLWTFMAFAVFVKYGRGIQTQPQLRNVPAAIPAKNTALATHNHFGTLWRGVARGCSMSM